MSAADSVARLDASLERSGEAVIIRRAGKADVPCNAKVLSLIGQEIRTGSSGSQLTGRAILSPSPFPAGFLPLRTTDKIVRGGQERAIGWADNKLMVAEYVRIVVDFAG